MNGNNLESPSRAHYLPPPRTHRLFTQVNLTTRGRAPQSLVGSPDCL